MLTRVFDCSRDDERDIGIEEAGAAIRRGELVVIPTDTVYGVAADAFTPSAVESLIDAFWPGALTVVVRHTAHLAWDLGETRGTVAVRMPNHEVARELISQTGPLAVSSANRTGNLAPATMLDARLQLGATIAVYLDGGPSGESVPSTIVDVTAERPRVLRAGAIDVERLREIEPEVEDPW
jgi:L-threonylcarbamoyladenylate synthase